MQSNTKNRRPSGNLMMRLAAVLFCMVMFSTYLMGGLYARYTAEADGQDKARVAKFDVKTSGPKGVEVLYSQGDSGEYLLEVQNGSEVAISYTVTVVVDKINFGIIVTLEDQVLNTNNATTVTVTPAPLAPGKTATHPLTFKVESWGEFTKFVAAQPSRSQDVGFTVTVDAVQVD